MMLSRWILAVLGLLHLINGLWMLLAPESWYAAVPGVPQTGPFNPHFITDIALAFMASGAGMMLALRAGLTAAALALAGAVWPALHGLFHLWEWIAEGIPRDPQILASDLIGVMLVGFLGIALGWTNARKQGVV